MNLCPTSHFQVMPIRLFELILLGSSGGLTSCKLVSPRRSKTDLYFPTLLCKFASDLLPPLHSGHPPYFTRWATLLRYEGWLFSQRHQTLLLLPDAIVSGEYSLFLSWSQKAAISGCIVANILRWLVRASLVRSECTASAHSGQPLPKVRLLIVACHRCPLAQIQENFCSDPEENWSGVKGAFSLVSHSVATCGCVSSRVSPLARIPQVNR